MDKRKDSISIKCPFFRYYDDHSVACEGVVKNSTVRLSFNSPDKRKRYMRDNCIECHEGCRVYKMLYGKYEGNN
jgi:hypothetical protein